MSDYFFSRPQGKFWTVTLPIWGCLRPCELAGSVCYAEKVAARKCGELEAVESVRMFHARNVVNEAAMQRLIRARKPRIVFNSMTEPAGWDNYAKQALGKLVESAPQHQFLVCTKRPAEAYKGITKCPVNVHLGFTFTNQPEFDERLAQMPDVPNLWAIGEPLRAPVDVSAGLKRLKWLVVGLETGRRIPVEGWWYDALNSIRYQCQMANVPLWEKAVIFQPDYQNPWRQMPPVLSAIWKAR